MEIAKSKIIEWVRNNVVYDKFLCDEDIISIIGALEESEYILEQTEFEDHDDFEKAKYLHSWIVLFKLKQEDFK